MTSEGFRKSRQRARTSAPVFAFFHASSVVQWTSPPGELTWGLWKMPWMGTNNKTCSLRLQHFRAGQEQQLRSTTRRCREMLPCRVALQGGGSSERTEPRRPGQAFFFFDRGNVERLAPSGKRTLVRIRLPLYPYQPIIFWSLPSFHQCRNSKPHWLIASNHRHRPGLSELLIPS